MDTSYKGNGTPVGTTDHRMIPRACREAFHRGPRWPGVELPLEKLDGAQVGPWRLSLEEDREAQDPHPVVVTATDGQREIVLLEGRTNPGTAWRHPWLEVRFSPRYPVDDEVEAWTEELQEELFASALGSVLTPGSYVMLSCDGHRQSLSALTVGVPPPATWLGYLLWQAGARWYKIWYYPEGWREGHEKLQGNVPLDETHRAKAEADRLEELEAFLGSSLADDYPVCSQRAMDLLDATRASREG